MNIEALEKVGDYFKEKELDIALLSNPATIAWLTGYAPSNQIGTNPFEGGPALGWWHAGKLTLVLSDAESTAAQAQGIETRDYLSYTIESPAAGFLNQGLVLKNLLKESGNLKGHCGVEFNFLPAALLEIIKDSLPLVSLAPLDGSFDQLRAIKTAREIELLRASLRICDLAQFETRRLIQPGISEIELWDRVKCQLDMSAGCRLPIVADFIAGSRTADIGGLPGEYIIAAGDAVIADIVPRLNGYWGDNAGTHFASEPSPDLKKMYQIVLNTLKKGIAAIKPGVLACDLDKMLRNAIQDEGYAPYPHHSGHGLGTSYHEEPRIVPYNQMKIQPGMVIAIEPGIYVPGTGGVRLEDVVLVTQDGCEVLTKHLGN